MARSARLARRIGAIGLALAVLGAVAMLVAHPAPAAIEAATVTPTLPPAPTISSISPTIGPYGGGTSVTIAGTNFASGATVTFDGIAATGTTVSGSTKITATTPADTPGTPVVVVTNTNGQAATFTGGFTYLGTPPTLTSISPASGSTNGDTTITLTGSAFATGMTVTIGGRAATSVIVESDTLAMALTPPGATTAAADVVVTNPDTQTATLTAAYTYVQAPSPTVTSVSPDSGTSAGKTTATIIGTDFASGATVTFGTKAATDVVVDSTGSITATVPAGTLNATVPVTVTNPDTQSGTLASAYTYVKLPAPTLTIVSPDSVPLTGFATVTLYGTGFVAPVTVTFGAVTANVLSVTPSTITVTLPASTSTTMTSTVTATVTNVDNQRVSLANAIQLVAPPSVTSVSPATVSTAGGTPITIRGTGFQSGATVTIDNMPATDVAYIGATSITATTPTGFLGGAQVTVMNPDGQVGSSVTALTYAVGPTVTAISPGSGVPAGGTTVTISGTDFASGDTVAFGGTAATGVTVVDSQTITATAPAGTGTTFVPVTVTDSGGIASNGNVEYAYVTPVPTFTLGTVPAQGIGYVSFSGGTDQQLADAATAAGCTSSTAFFVLVNGSFVTYIPGAPSAVNAAWDTHFGGTIPAGTLLAVRCG